MKSIQAKISGIACVSLLLSSAGIYGANKKPNIVLLLADDISRDDFGCYGHPLVKTPNIDGLAKNGLKFNNVFLTASSSSPSRCSIITGRYPHNTGACELHSPIGDEQVFFPCLLKEAGYYTAQGGKWHIGGGEIDPGGPAEKCFDKAGGSKKDGGGASGSKTWVSRLQERPMDKPFFMWFSSHDAHRDYWDNEAVLDNYNPKDVVPYQFHVNDATTRKDLAGYYNEVSRFDYFVGEVVKELKAQKVLENTIIVIMADNGRAFPRAKTLLLKDGIVTPFIVHYPEKIKKAGATCNSLVSVIDLAPTFVELAEAKTSPTFQGKSFVKLLENPNQKFRQYVFAEHNWHVSEAYERMVCTEDYMLIENKRPKLGVNSNMGTPTGKSLKKGYEANTLTEVQAEIFINPRPEVLLFAWQKDVDQVDNLATKKPKETENLLKVLHQWQDETGDSVPEYLKPARGKKVDYESLVEMPGASKNATLNNNPGPF